MHRHGYQHRVGQKIVHVPPEEAFAGLELKRFANTLKALIRTSGATRLLDYGSGKGQQYVTELRQGRETLADSLADYWGIKQIVCHDPGLTEALLPPPEMFDGVIVSRVLDRLPEEDLDWVLDALFQRASGFVFCEVAGHPSRDWVPTGENARIILQSKAWWASRLIQYSIRHGGVPYCLAYSEEVPGEDGLPVHRISFVHNCPGVSLPNSERNVRVRLQINRPVPAE
ncbi:hypothetical protein GCM10007924_07510 [Sneathiella chinensis]|uniref:Class I SAM-dependent methyltransferase n=2 Tax=Sneathiella chinensis TaxID=349750 RepID=A0ABQ5U2X0_9PROT|nr:hypothetical protein GCM10007924_07510 [Sneathiella chinensis]